ncbi:hypothetical protein LSH36_486g06055 [Paralvinella palmiformis]|uniref:Uncharacterized protein n=1 Tax=Paralvinella palmiformis TaxID=53620 RepID=A0AAD9MZH8_9ANNE|nr:hypothetical protein LSH36_486g06055 [Paralvinella palmiformis]
MDTEMIPVKSAQVSPADFDTGGDLVWKTKTIYVKSKGETQPYNIRRNGHLTEGVGSGRYKVNNLGMGSTGPKHVVASRSKEGIQTGPPNCLIQPVDTLVSHPDVYDFSSGVATPGPTYKPRSERGYKKSIGLPAKEVAAEGPGPAAYDTRDKEEQGPAYTIARRVPLAGYGKQREFTPGPNQYTLPETVGNGPAAVLTYKPFEVAQGAHPGPADYTIKDTTLKKTPTHAFAQRTKPHFPDILQYPDTGSHNPAPCDYSDAALETISKNRGPKFSMGRKLKRFRGDVGPGPAAYFPQLPRNKQGFSITKKPTKSIGESTPASNSYDIKRNLTNKGEAIGPKFSLRSRHSPFVYSGFRNINVIRG